MKDNLQYNILYSCTSEPKRGDDPFIREHCFTYIHSGEIEIHNNNGIITYGKGSLGLIRRNQLIKVVKKPLAHEPFLSVNIFISQETLKKHAIEHNINSTGLYIGEPNILLPIDKFMRGFISSMLPYFENPKSLTPTLASIKTIEVIELLIRNPSLTNLLFDFSEPFKSDLEGYMNRHFAYNVPIGELAYLTGRSLSTFKRDFTRIFETSPEKWLQKRRLIFAHYLLTQKGRRPSDIYLEVGFENLSHFSTSFKKEFGSSPASIVR